MNKLFVTICALLILSIVTGCSTKTRPPLEKGPSLHLYVNVPTNDAYWVENVVRQLGRYGFQGEEVRLEGVTRFVYQIRAVLRTRSGETRLAVTPRFYTIDEWLVTPRGDRMRPPEVEALFKTAETVVRNHPFTITLAANGTIVDTDGLTELENALAGVIGRYDIEFAHMDPVDREAWRRVFMKHIDERPIRRHLYDTFGILPTDFVRLGDRWVETPINKPWPFLPTEETVRLINLYDDHYLLETETAFTPPRGSSTPTYQGHQSGRIHLDAETRLGTEQQSNYYWKRKRKRTPWEQFTLKSVEGSESTHMRPGPFSESPHLNAVNRFPFMEK